MGGTHEGHSEVCTQHEEEMQKDLLISRLSSMPTKPVINRGGPGHQPVKARKRDYSVINWQQYFDRKQLVRIDDNNKAFNVYQCGGEGPVLFFIHGAGLSAVSWALLCSELSSQVTCQCSAMDIRGHGDTDTLNESDLSIERLSSDVGIVIEKLYGDEPPPIILIGHSLGGAIAVHTVARDLLKSVVGLVVIDVVEGSALDALNSMQSFLKSRPKTFPSQESAIEWCVRSGQVRNLESARVTMIGQLCRVNEDVCQTECSQATCDMLIEADEDGEEDVLGAKPATSSATESSSAQPVEEALKSQSQQSSTYTWRVDLSKTESHWKGWFQGLSQLFLSCPVPKLLLLAGMDRLDKDLTIGQMQGKFQLSVLPRCGHAVHEDVPDKVADILCTFLSRHKMATPVGDVHKPYPPSC